MPAPYITSCFCFVESHFEAIKEGHVYHGVVIYALGTSRRLEQEHLQAIPFILQRYIMYLFNYSEMRNQSFALFS